MANKNSAKNIYPDPFIKRPRIYIKLPSDKIDLGYRFKNSSVKSRPILLTIGMPIMMIVSLIMMSILTKRSPIFMLPMLVMTLGSMSFSIWNFISERKAKKDEKVDGFQTYLTEKTTKLSHLRGNSIEILNKRFLETPDLVEKIDQNDSSLFTVNTDDYDFLDFSVGLGEISPNYQLSMQNTEENQELTKIYNHFSVINNAPIVINAKNNLGIIGDSDLTVQYIQNRLIQLIFCHSYLDLKIAVLSNSNTWKMFAGEKHIDILRNKTDAKKYFDQLAPILNTRKSNSSDRNESTFAPHFLMIVENPALLENSSVTQYIDKNAYQLNLSIIYLTDSKNNLPSYISNVTEIKNENSGVLTLLKNEKTNKAFSFDFADDADIKRSMKILSQVNHQTENQSVIPEKLTFFEMLNLKKAGDLNIAKNWNDYQNALSLAIPIGKTSEEDLIYLDVHEKGDGPHGLVAGTTGSGKSELISTILLGLSTFYRPEYVGFLIIDFKGGGLANQFEKIPHLLGSITNLDKRSINRSLASIKAELEYRQRQFQKYKVNSFNDYFSLYLEDKKMDAIPHLIIVVDEFAEVKKEQPDFFKELTSVARIGRSLGVHLILATQKPRGVIDDQVWSNSKYKIALKMQDTSDSKEVLKTEDAAEIKEVGRAYLQVGNNERYQLFQSAYSAEKNNGVTQFNLVTEKIENTFKETKAVMPKAPWLDELPLSIISPTVNDKINLSSDQFNPVVPFGMLDLPAMQSQENFDFDLLEFKNTIIVGDAQMGKTTALINIITNLAKNNSPELINFNIFDFANNDLLSVSDLPQVANYVTIEDTLSQRSLIKQIDEQIDERKELLKELKAKNINEYNLISENKLPIQLNIVENYDAVKNHQLENELNELFAKIARDGQSLGLYLMMTAHQFNTIRLSFSNLFNTKIAVSLESYDQLINVLTRRIDEIQKEPGRFGIVLDKEVVYGQIYLPTSDQKELFNLVEKIKKNWKGDLPVSIPKVPASFSTDYLIENSKDKFSLGFDIQTAAPVSIDSGTVIISENNNDTHKFVSKILKKQFDKSTSKIINLHTQKAIEEFDPANMDSNVIYHIDNFENFMEIKPLDDSNLRRLNSELEIKNSVLVIQSSDFYLEDFSFKTKEVLYKKSKLSIIFTRVSEQNYLQPHNQTVNNESRLGKNQANYFDGRNFGILRYPDKL